MALQGAIPHGSRRLAAALCSGVGAPTPRHPTDVADRRHDLGRRCFHNVPRRLQSRPISEMNQNNVSGEGPAKGSGQHSWLGAAGPAAFDLRSDTATTPTPSMLAAVQTCSLRDDVFNEDPTTIDLEAHCAGLCGMEAGLFVLSGTMGNQLAIRSLLTQPPYGVLCDFRSHLFTSEAGGAAIISGTQLKPARPKNGVYLTLEDIKEQADLDDDVHTCPTRVISLENTLHGMVTPLAEIQRISAFAREHGIKLHLDGSRLWEVAAAGEGSLADFSACFDTVTLCFSKGLGAPIGSILLGSKQTMRTARWIRKAIGGGVRQAGVMTAAARVAVDETFGTGPSGEGGLLKNTHVLAKQVEKMWTDLGGKVVKPVQTNMCWLDNEAAGVSSDAFDELGKAEGLKMWAPRLVFHYQIYQNRDEVVPRLERVFRRAMELGVSGTDSGKAREEFRYGSH